jgi:histidine triad (HIT) family protein
VKPCIFCAIVAHEAPAHFVLEEPEIVAFLDARPLFHGHVLVVPRTHVATLAEAPAGMIGAVFETAKRVSAAFGPALGAEGTFLAMNDRISQSVPHVHAHVIPRRKGDGLKGFFWPRQPYESDEQAASIAGRIRSSLEPAGKAPPGDGSGPVSERK